MAKKKVILEPTYVENIETESMDNIMDSRTALYAKEIIQDRAIPDLRDGLKPVQRRIIYSMYRANNTFDHATKKCAGIVGDVMGKFHPHGDTSIYEALARMSQEWKMSVPLIKFQGNNGSIDGDDPAAYRYTEAKLNEFSNNLINDIDKNTVDMTLNFDDTLFEPTVLPCRYPNLFVNGGSGIAFAIATEIPPHNLNEMCEAVIYRINHPSSTLDELLEIVKGPDFPTGGIIYKTDAIKQIYETGRGRVEVLSKVDINREFKDHNELIITNIPYGVLKIELVHSIDKIRKNREIDGIIEVLDATDGDDIKIIVSLKKEIDPDVVIKYLMSKTQLKSGFNANIVAIDKNTPRILPLIDYIDDFISFQQEIIIRRSKFDLAKCRARLHIVEGLITAINNVNEVIRIIRASKDKEDSKNNLIVAFNFSNEQAEAIVMMRLHKLSNTDVNTYLTERDNLKATIADLLETIATPLKVKHIIVDDLRLIAKKFGKERRTLVLENENQEKTAIDHRALIINESCYVNITHDGYINRCSVKSHDASIGFLPKLKENDYLVCSTLCNTHDYILAFTNKGNYILISVYEIEEGKFKDSGKHINYLATLPFDEFIIKTIIVRDFDKRVNIALVSKNGQIKKTLLPLFYAQRTSKPICCMKLSRDDEVVDVAILHGNDNVLVITKVGNLTCFKENEISSSGLKTSGIKSISTLKNSEVKSLFSFKDDDRIKLLFVTNNRMYRTFVTSNVVVTSRLGKTQFAFKSFKSDPHELIYSQVILKNNEDIFLNLLLEDKTIENYVVSDLSLTPIDKYCKANMELVSNAKIKEVFINNVDIIDNKTLVEESNDSNDAEIIEDDNQIEVEEVPLFEDENKSNIEVKTLDIEEAKEEEEDYKYEQISIFDDMGD